MRRSRQFRPTLDSLTSRLLPSDMLPFILAMPNPLSSPPVSAGNSGLIDSANAIPVYAPGPGYAIDDPYCLAVLDTHTGNVYSSTSSM